MKQHYIWKELEGRLWHTTHPERFQRILECGAIFPEPDIPDRERWSTRIGPSGYPYVRTLGGVSLFDFRQFDLEQYSNEYPVSSWEEFVPYRRSWGCAVWIEIDRAKISTQFKSGAELLIMQNEEKKHRNKIMPYIEAAHLGPIPVSAFIRAFVVNACSASCEPISIER
jgi:hypothetical protein